MNILKLSERDSLKNPFAEDWVTHSFPSPSSYDVCELYWEVPLKGLPFLLQDHCQKPSR